MRPWLCLLLWLLAPALVLAEGAAAGPAPAAADPAGLRQGSPGGLAFRVPLPAGPLEEAELKLRDAQRGLPSLGTEPAPASAAAARIAALWRRHFVPRPLNTAEAAFARRLAQSSAGGGGDSDNWTWTPPSREDERP